MSRKNNRKNKKCTKKQAQRQCRIQDAVTAVLHTPNHRVYKSWEDCQETVVKTTSQDQDTVVDSKQDQNNVAPKQTLKTPQTSNKTLKTPQTSNQNQKNNKQDQNNGNDGVRDQADKKDTQSDNYSANPDRQDNSDTQDKPWEDNQLQGNQNKPKKQDLQFKQNNQDNQVDSQENHQKNHQKNHQEKLQDNLVENNNQDEHWGEDQTGDFYVNVSATKEQALKIALEATEADFDPANRIFFTYGANVSEKMTRLPLGNKANNNQGRKKMAGAAAICKQPSTENNRVSWHGQQWTLGYSQTTSAADAELVAISGCLSVAAKELRPAKDNKTAPPKVTIITYDQDATDKIAEVLHWDPRTQCHPEASQALVEIVQKARNLGQSVGAVIELLCINKHAVTVKMRGNSGPVIMRGNQYAENAAWKAAKTPGIKLPSCSQMTRLN